MNNPTPEVPEAAVTAGALALRRIQRVDPKFEDFSLAKMADAVLRAALPLCVPADPLEYWLYSTTDAQFRELFDARPVIAQRLRDLLATAPGPDEAASA